MSDENGPVVPASVADFEQVVAKLVAGEQLPERLQPHLAAAEAVSSRRKFFHWALEFPDVFFERGGFDAVIGNPPWNTLSPDVKEFFGTYDPTVFRKGVSKGEQDERKDGLREDIEVDVTWRREARFLHELSNFAKPESGRFAWFTEDGQLRKGDANVFRLFVERAHRLLRTGGRLGQVLPDSVYVSSPATGVREHLLHDGLLECCWVFENRRGIFPIDSRIKIVLLVAQRGGGPTEAFRAAFLTGKDAAGRERAIGLDTLPDVLADLDEQAPVLTVDQVRALAPSTLAFPELQTALDAEIVAHCAAAVPPLNLDERGWGLTYCRELDADRDAFRFRGAPFLEARGAVRRGLRWIDPEGFEWWPLVEGSLYYQLEFPATDQEPMNWVSAAELLALEGRINPDGTSVGEHYRVSWRDVARSTDERSAIATVLPPRTIAKHTAPTTWGGSLDTAAVVALAGLLSSFCFDALVRFLGKGHLTYGAVNAVPAPSQTALRGLVPLVTRILGRSDEFDSLRDALGVPWSDVVHDYWEVAELRAQVDAHVALAYGLTISQYAALLCGFPNVDRSQPMLPAEPKSFVTRDLALKAFCDLTKRELPDTAKLMREIASGLPDPRPEFRSLEARLRAYADIGAVPYRPTPKGARLPTDSSLLEDVLATLSDDAQSSEEIAEALGEDAELVSRILKELKKSGAVYTEGRGKNARYYVVGDD